jgi:prophage regulatory protein
MKCIPWKVLKEIVPYARQHIARLEAAGKFPLRVKLGPCRVCWMLDEIEAWLRERIDNRSLTHAPGE